MSRKTFTSSITILGVIMIICMFMNITSTIYNQSQKIDLNSSQIVSAFDG